MDLDLSRLLQSDAVVLLLIFCARILDVSIGTIRIILVSRGYRALAPLFGFFEVLIWLAAIGQVMGNMKGFGSYLVYAGGFATGNYVGMLLESRIAFGYQALRIITSEKIQSLPMVLRDEGYGVTTIRGWGAKGEVTFIYTIVPRKRVDHVLDIVAMFEPQAFISIEDVKARYSGYFSRKKHFMESVNDLFSKRK